MNALVVSDTRSVYTTLGSLRSEGDVGRLLGGPVRAFGLELLDNHLDMWVPIEPDVYQRNPAFNAIASVMLLRCHGAHVPIFGAVAVTARTSSGALAPLTQTHHQCLAQSINEMVVAVEG